MILVEKFMYLFQKTATLIFQLDKIFLSKLFSITTQQISAD